MGSPKKRPSNPVDNQMPDEAEYQAALAQVESYAEDFDIEITDKVSEEDEDGNTLQHIVMRSEGQVLYVSGDPDLNYFGVSYPLDLRSFIGNGLPEEDIENILSDSEYVESIESVAESEAEIDKLRQQSATELLMDADQIALRDAADKLVLVAGGGQVNVDIKENEDIPFTGFLLVSYIFPYESDFNFRRFSQRVTELMAAGQRAIKTLQQSIVLLEPEESDTGDFELEIKL